MFSRSASRFLLVSTVLASAACAIDDADSDASAEGCIGGKCDTPNDPPEESCAKRQAEVIASSNRGYTSDGIRWACADVEGVNANGRDDRGQEYCEYYAIVELPNGEAIDMGRNRSGGGVTDLALCVEGDEEARNCRATITEDELFELEDSADKVVGACMFNSWHADIDEPFPACKSDKDCDAEVFGFPLTAEFARMKVRFNSNSAAADLVEKCFDLGGLVPEPNFDDADDPNNDPFFRGCMATNGLFGTEWRRSDPSICAAVNRLAECGCTAPGVDSAEDLGRAVVPRPPAEGAPPLRGFRLGTWDDTNGLPPGCRYNEVGDDSRTSVRCDLTATDLINSLNDPKEACRSIYGGNVVVHVDLPASALSCEDTDEFGQACGNQPWNIGDENAGGGDNGGGGGDDECGLRIAEVFYDASGADDGREWVKLYNSCDDDLSLDGMRLAWGGSAYKGEQALEGEVAGGSCFIVGGTKSDSKNGSPDLDQKANFSPDLQNSGKEADGVALFSDGDVPVDAVIYGEQNVNGLIDASGKAVDPHVGDAPEGGSIVLVDEGRWEVSDAPRAGDCPDF